MESQQKSKESSRVTKTLTANHTGESPLFPNLNNVKLPKIIMPTKYKYISKLRELGVWDSEHFSHELEKFSKIDVLTYSISPNFVSYGCDIDRVMFVVGKPPKRAKRVVQVSGTHAKVWLCYTKHQSVSAFIGSANAVELTLHEFVIRLTPAQTLAMKEYFDELFNKNYKP